MKSFVNTVNRFYSLWSNPNVLIFSKISTIVIRGNYDSR